MSRKIWNYSIQFFIVVLGVFITVWIGNITERAKENKKTREALEMIREELTAYLESMDEKVAVMEASQKMYHDIFLHVLDDIPLPDHETLADHRLTFLYMSFGSIKYMSLEIAEKSGVFGNIKNLTLIEDIYNAFQYIELIHDLMQNDSDFRLQTLIANTTPGNTKATLNTQENSQETVRAFWDEVITKPGLYQAITNGVIHTQFIEAALIAGREQIKETLLHIDKFIN